MRMKILWISQNLPYPPKTGVLQRNYHLIRETSKFADVHLVAILKRDILPGFDEELAVRELGRLCTRVDVARLPIETSRIRFVAVVLGSLFTKEPFTSNWARSPVLERLLAQPMIEGGYDAVYFDTISLAGYARLGTASARVLNHHNIESHLLGRRIEYEQNPLRRLYYLLESRKLRRYEAAVAAKFDTHFVVSRLDAERLSRIAPGVSTSVVANGVDVEYFQNRDAVEEPGHVVMVSGMNWFPNRDAAIFMVTSIWPLIAKAVPTAKLTIVGASPPQAAAELAARDPRVKLTGFVDDVRPYFGQAQVYLCPMRDGGGTRLKILDALAMRMPVVATEMALEGIGVVPEEHVVVGNGAEAFSEQVVRLIRDRTLCRRLGDNGRSFVEQHFSWPVIGREMHRAFMAARESRLCRG